MGRAPEAEESETVAGVRASGRERSARNVGAGRRSKSREEREGSEL